VIRAVRTPKVPARAAFRVASPLLLPVDPQRVDGPAAVGVVHDGPLGTGRGVIADKEGDLEGRVQAGTHRVGLVGAGDHFGGGVEFVEDKVAHIAVRIVDHES